MPKKCVLCNENARYFVKGMENESYCRECAEINFDLENLEKINAED